MNLDYQYFNRPPRSIKSLDLNKGDESVLPIYNVAGMIERLNDLLGLQNDFYPCFDWTFPPPIFSPASGPCLVEELFSEKSITPGRFSIYLHIPFCESICKHCYYTAFSIKDPKYLRRYTDYLIKEMYMYSNILDNQTCESIYLGGGTPTYLPNNLLEMILTNIHNALNR
uniref:Oxygen-independent coproporphyrinogen-3 oxidase n=1 Tax=Candidatus Kentrum sp. FW TaxID=2126338 RepID=A0A450T2C3_9GAMM|nr:MAG: hypothetical protein BECKFW1821A_GA0114235_11026 [Candidatus Kentron sp. FW]